MHSLKQVTSCAVALAVAALSLASSVNASPYNGRLLQARYINDSSLVKDAYDYVIVGGGTSGLTVADRLTEDGKATVLVIENGPLPDSAAVTEVRGGFGAFSSPYFYRIQSAPQPELHNASYPVLVGNAVGGSSAVNAMMTVRGTAEDYDRWGLLYRGGGSGRASPWGWDGLLPYFKKAVAFTEPDPAVRDAVNIAYDASYWGNTSGVFAGWPTFQYPGLVPQIEAFRDIPGVEFPPDSGSGRAGVYWHPSFMDPSKVQRSYARTGHYDGINRTSYDLAYNSKVRKINLEDLKATGVVFQTTVQNATQLITVKANKEVILAAGAVHTPQLLQLSGVGPKKQLDEADIETVVDLPGVGQNFQDHPMLGVTIMLRNFTVHPSPMDLITNRNFSSWAKEMWAKNRTGPYSLGIGNVAAWLGMPVISPERHETIASKLEAQDHAAYLPPDTDPTVIAGYKAQMNALATSIRSTNTAFYSLTLYGSNVPAGSTVFLHPLSRGSVRLNPSTPSTSEPIVDYRTLSNPLDIEILAEFVRFTRAYHFNTSLAAYDPHELLPGSDVTSDADLATYIRRSLSPSEYHPSGTAAMLPRELGGVVDEQLKVVMPTLPGANTCQTVYAIAEKAADLIKADA
ncbi:oxidoreductase [Apiospora phragmitis]|uniref:Oxidoreductase n=1 Tax=Apiospora phragmitis TaxID=2905665 RepID=A0ABR1T2X9_9PEZI